MKKNSCFMMAGLAFAWATLAHAQADADENASREAGDGKWHVYEGTATGAPILIEAPDLGEKPETRWVIDMVPLLTDTKPLSLLLPGGQAELELLDTPDHLEVFFSGDGIPRIVQNAGNVAVMPSDVMPGGALALAGGWTVMVRITPGTESETMENHRGRHSHFGNPKNGGARLNNAKDALRATFGAETEGSAGQGNEQESSLKGKYAQASLRMPEILSGCTQSRLTRTRDEHRRLKAFSVK